MTGFFRKYGFIVLGSVFVVLAFIGVILPVLPTTPFLLLASFFYLRSSQKLHDWLINNKLFGEYLYNYITYKAVKKKAKVYALIFLWLSLGLSMYLCGHLIIRIVLVVVGAGVSAHILTLNTLALIDTENESEDPDN